MAVMLYISFWHGLKFDCNKQAVLHGGKRLIMDFNAFRNHFLGM